MARELEPFLADRGLTVADVIKKIDANGEGIVMLVADDGTLESTLTDGDLRRAMLAGVALDDPLERVLELGKPSRADDALVAKAGTRDADLLQMMLDNVIRQLPLVDSSGKVVDLALLRDLVEDHEKPLEVMVMAGGYGTRVLPLTETTPKPMLHVGDKPLLERTLESLRSSGINKVNLALHHLSDRITSYFGDGHRFGLELSYVTEDTPLGTAGALRSLEGSKEPILVINADILTKVDFRSMLAYHQEHKADLTMAVRKLDVAVPYGVVECDGHLVKSVVEKPDVSVVVNAGIYLIEPGVIGEIPLGERFDMTELVSLLVSQDRRVIAFLVHEYWLDIGRHEDYEQAQLDAKHGLVD